MGNVFFRALLCAVMLSCAVPNSGVSQILGDEPWNNPTYLDDPGQFAKLRETVKRLRSSGSCVWLYDELGYPSCSAGGRVLEGHPEFQVEVIGCRTFRCATGESINVAPEHGSVESHIALPIRDGQLVTQEQIDLTAKVHGGTFTWQAPSGQWAVCLFERFQPDTWRRHNIPRHNVNMLDQRAVARFVELTHQRYGTELGQQIGDIQAFFTDEPQFGSAEHWGGGLPQCVPMVQWCDELPALFRQKTGYDVRSVLPSLFHIQQSLADAVTWIDGRVPRLVRWEGPTEVRLLHRQKPGRDLLVVANPSQRVAEGRLTAPSKGTASVWDRRRAMC